mgnify:CR=1 FL=1|jgi:hypothetical protein
MSENNLNNYSYMPTEGTDMVVGMLAASEKLVSTPRRVEYEHNNNEQEHEREHDYNHDHHDHDHDKLDEGLDGYRNKNELEPEKQEKEKDNNSEHKINDQEDESSWTDEELLLKKLEMLRKLGELVQRKVKLSQNYNLNSSYKMMKYEYELHSGIRSKQNAINWMGGMMIGLVQGIELLNDYLNPFEITFDGTWSNKVKNNITDYYEVIGDIYEKYAGSGKKMAPELKLFMMLTGSALTIQMHRGIANLTKSSNDNDNNDNDQIKELRQEATNKEELEERERKQKELREKINLEHQAAAMKVADLQRIQSAKKEINQMHNSKNEQLNNSLLFSDTAKSQHSIVNEQIKQQLIQQQLIQQQQQQQQQHELVQQNKKLTDIQQMIGDMKKHQLESKIYSDVENNIMKNEMSDKKKKPVIIKKPVDTVSHASTSSTTSISVNPKLSNIIKKVKKENEIVITDNKLKRISYNKSDNKSDSTTTTEKDDIRESISLAKSNGSGTKKPRKSLKLSSK